MNRLLINMENKIDILTGAIKQCDQLLNNETIHLNGLYKMDITKGMVSDADLINRRNSLLEERNKLQIKVERMNGWISY